MGAASWPDGLPHAGGAAVRRLAGALLAALNRVEKYGRVGRGADGVFRVPGKYWTITMKEMVALEAGGCVRIDQDNGAVVAVFLERPGEDRKIDIDIA